MRLHSWLSEKCVVKQSKLAGLGVFATEDFHQNELVAVWGGIIYTAHEISVMGEVFPHFHTHPFEVAEGLFMGSNSNTALDDSERFNHSCEPNIGVKGQIIVLARRAIRAGEELVFDYETTDIAPSPFSCRCGASSCRQTIDGNSWKNPDFLNKNRDWLSWYINEKVKNS